MTTGYVGTDGVVDRAYTASGEAQVVGALPANEVGGDSVYTSYSATPPPPVLLPILSLDAGNPASYSGGPTWTDTIGGAVFTLFNGPAFNAANGGYLTFDGVAQYGSTATSPSLAKFSIASWFKTSQVNTAPGAEVLTSLYNGGYVNYSLGFSNGAWPNNPATPTNFSGGFYTSDAGGYWLTPAGIAPVVGSWYYAVVTYDGAAVKLYINGGLHSSTPAVASIGNDGLGMNIANRWDFPNFFAGSIATIQLWNDAISATAVINNFYATKARFGL